MVVKICFERKINVWVIDLVGNSIRKRFSMPQELLNINCVLSTAEEVIDIRKYIIFCFICNCFFMVFILGF